MLPPEIFEILETLPTGAGGEYQLTDAMKTLAQTKGMTGVDFTGKRYDMGSKLGFLIANIENGLKNTVDVLQGRDNVISAEQDMLQSKYMALLYIQLLKFYTGEKLEL